MNTPTLPTLTGTAVTLRPITDADTDLIVKWRNTPSVVQNFIFRQTFTPEMHRSWLATKVATGQVVQYIILDNADGKPVGSVYYRDIDNHNRSAEYGIFIGEESARGKGLGTETARLFTQFGVDTLHLHRRGGFHIRPGRLPQTPILRCRDCRGEHCSPASLT